MRKSDIDYKRKALILLKVLKLDKHIDQIQYLKTAKDINNYLFSNEEIKERYKNYLKILIEDFLRNGK